MSQSKQKLYQCQIDIQFPTAIHALHAKEVLQVDGEIGDQITKTLDVINNKERNNNNNDDNDNVEENCIHNNNDDDDDKNILSV